MPVEIESQKYTYIQLIIYLPDVNKFVNKAENEIIYEKMILLNKMYDTHPTITNLESEKETEENNVNELYNISSNLNTFR